ncbi:MAG: ABC transporter substrate-binding protein [Rubellimicrobium sp.]|nr:ABC transporter substrate-binding protein [Rubellimicrobium sp.]
MKVTRRTVLGTLAATSLVPAAALAQDNVLKVGVVLPMTGGFQSNGRQMQAAINAFVATRGDTAAGRRIELIIKDDASVGDNALRISQELVTRDGAEILTGYGYTPAALAGAQISARGRIPQIVTVAATSSIIDASPYVLRTSQTTPQIATPIGEWAPANGARRFMSIVSDYGPGVDAETWFEKSLLEHGGEVLEKLRVPLANPDFAPFLQRAIDQSPDALFVFVPTGAGAAFMKQFVERGLDQSGIRVIAMSDMMDDDLLNSMGDPALGVITGGPYSAAHDSPENHAFVEAFKAANDGMRPNVVAVGVWDALQLIHDTLEKTGGDASGEAFVEAARGTEMMSARGPIRIDPETREIVQNIYMRRVERGEDGELYNVEFETFEAVADPTH